MEKSGKERSCIFKNRDLQSTIACICCKPSTHVEDMYTENRANFRIHSNILHLSETTSFTLPFHQGQDITLTNRSLEDKRGREQTTLTFLTMLRLEESMKMTRTYN